MFKTFLSRGCKSKKLWYYIIYICWKIIDSIELIIAIEAHKYLNRNYVIIRVLCIRERYNISVCNLHECVVFYVYELCIEYNWNIYRVEYFKSICNDNPATFNRSPISLRVTTNFFSQHYFRINST